jgi:hypothetical protein
MGKGFTLQDTEGQDLAHMFHEAFERKVKRREKRRRWDEHH